MRILLRCDADETIGLGHASRALALAEEIALLTGGLPLLIAQPSPLLERLAEAQGVEIRSVGGAGYVPEAVAAASSPGDVVVSDTYDLDAAALEAVAAAGLRHLVIDDFATLERYPCDVVVNPNVGADAAAYSGAAAVLAGPRYALLRREVRDAARRAVARRGPVRRLLVCLGGGAWPADARALLEGLVREAGGEAEIRATTIGVPAGVVAVAPGALAEQLVWADAAVLSAGVVKYEAAACGLPAVLTAVVEHQSAIASAFAATGAAVDAGPLAGRAEEVVAEAMRLIAADDLRERTAARARALVDGEGARRAATVFVEGSAMVAAG